MADQVAHQDVYHIIIETHHRGSKRPGMDFLPKADLEAERGPQPGCNPRSNEWYGMASRVYCRHRRRVDRPYASGQQDEWVHGRSPARTEAAAQSLICRIVGNSSLEGHRGRFARHTGPELAYKLCDDRIRSKSSVLFEADNASKWRNQRIVVTRREFVRTFAIASAGALMRAAPESVARSYDFESVRQYILQAIAKENATGVAVAVARRGSIIWEKGFGWANRESGLKATANTPFSLASITKPFTTTTLMTLVAEGKLHLDDPANKYLRLNKIKGPNGDPNEATLRRLGAHVGGLPSMFEWYFPSKGQYSPTAENLLGDYGRLAYPPGSCYEYGNIGYAALSAAAANVTRMDFGSLMTRRVLEPLGLRDSFFGTNTERLKTSAARPL